MLKENRTKSGALEEAKIMFKVSPQMYAAISSAARSYGLSVSSFVRLILMLYLRGEFGSIRITPRAVEEERNA